MPNLECSSEVDLEAYLLGELPKRIARLVAEHLKHCASCEAVARKLDLAIDPTIHALRQSVRSTRNLGSDVTPNSYYPATATCKAPLPPAGDFTAVRIAGYQVLGELGRGGMSVVYKARQRRPSRLVALKMILAGAHASAERRARFLSEADAIAKLRHPQIVQIYEVGQHEGVPFLALEYVQGGSLAQRLGGKFLLPRQAASLLEQLARAVHYAHGQGIIHRDLKPGNVLLDEVEAGGLEEQNTPLVSDSSFRILPSSLLPKITDFGLAKQDRVDLTATGAILGTPSYMAPEQIESGKHALGPATDVYGLGAILYECLTGSPPFLGTSALETMERVRSQQPISPRLLQPQTPLDLATICCKCLRKEPESRYASALDLAEDLRCFLDDKAIRARPVSALERAWRWAWRNPSWAAMLAGVGFLLMLVSVGSSVFSWRLHNALKESEERGNEAVQAEHDRLQQLFQSYVTQARAETLSRGIGQRTGALQTANKARGVARDLNLMPGDLLELRSAACAALALADLRPAPLIMEADAPNWRYWSSFDIEPSFRHYAIVNAPGTISVRRTGLAGSAGEELARLNVDDHTNRSLLYWSLDGRFLVVPVVNRLQVWKMDESRAVRVFEWAVQNPRYDFTADRLNVVSVDDGIASVYDLASGALRQRFPAPPGVTCIAAHPSQPRVALATSSGVTVLDLRTGQSVAQLAHDAKRPSANGIDWHPDGNILAVAYGNEIDLWDVARQRRLHAFSHPDAGIVGFFNRSGDILAGTGWRGRLVFWDTHTGRTLFTTAASSLGSPRFGPGDLLSMVFPGTFQGKHWRLSEFVPSREFRTMAPMGGTVKLSNYKPLSVDPHGRLLAVSRQNGVGIYELATGKELAVLELGQTRSVLFELSGALLTYGPEGAQRWPVSAFPSQAALLRMGPPEAIPLPGGIQAVFQSGDGTIMAASVGDGAIVWQRDRPKEARRLRPQDDCRSVAVSPNGRLVVTGSHNGSGLKIWNAQTGNLLKELPCEGGTPTFVFSPDGSWLLSSQGQRWAVDDWAPGPAQPVGTVALSPDGRIMAVAPRTPERGDIRLFDFASGGELVRLSDPNLDGADELTFTPDGAQLVVTTLDSQCAAVWDLRLIRQELAALDLDWDMPPYPPAPATVPLPIEIDLGTLSAATPP
jgi:serine/threonine protein kinase/WD40 repeat protein